MNRYKNILVYVPVDDLRTPNPAVQHAAALAENNDADIKLLCVHDSFWTPRDNEALKNQAKSLRERGVRVTTEHPWGAAAEEIIREVIRNNHDVVMKTAKPEDAKRISFGTTGMQLMRMCPCPVWIVQPSQKKPYQRVLATIDPRSEPDANDSLNVTILELATSLGQCQNAELFVLHAWSANCETKPVKSKANAIRGHVQSSAIDLRKRLADLLLPFADAIPDDRVRLIEGAAATVIPEFARDHQIDIIVMGTVARTGVAGFWIGNTAERVLRQVSCSVLALKPSGFVSPN